MTNAGISYPKRVNAEDGEKQRRYLVFGVWIYFLLLIFEGALRKWVLPGLAGPLLIVRDPVAIVMILYAWYWNLFPTVSYVTWMVIISMISIFTTLFIGHGNLSVTLYGARTLLIHFPFIFLIGSVFDESDVHKMGKVLIWISIPMALLLGMQFFSPQSAFVNRGVGGDLAGSGFSGAMGYFRPTATFSFTNGTVLFFSFVASYLFYFWLKPNQMPKIVLMAATAGLMVAIPFSISRGLGITVAVMLIFVLVAVSRKPKFLGQILVGGFGFLIAISLLSNAEFFQTSTEVFMNRFDNAAEVEGGLEGTLVDRYLGGMVEAIYESTALPFFGLGLGLGTNAGSMMISGTRSFIISEGEWGRIVGEMGALLGIGVIFMRLSLSYKTALESYKRLVSGDILPWMLLSFALLVFPQGQWAQPTNLGFSTMIMGLLIASFNKAKDKTVIEGKEKIEKRL